MSTPMPLEDTDWFEDALAALIGLAAKQNIVTAEDLKREMREPPHKNMVGSVFLTAKSLRYIVPTGYRPSHTKSRRGGVIRTWTLHPNEERKAA